MLRRDDILIALLLFVGLFFPTSVGGDSLQSLLGIALLALLIALLYLAWKHGTRPRAAYTVSLPILCVLAAGTLIAWNFRFGWGIFASYTVIAAVLALDLRQVRPGRAVLATFFAANVVWIVCGAVVVVGNEWVSDFLSTWYSQFFPELVPGMLRLHKPVLTFGTHSLAGFFTYLFFWLNWEKYKAQGKASSLIFSMCELVLLFAITSFTSFGFAAIAIVQIGFWLRTHNRRLLFATSGCLVLTAALAGRVIAEQIDTLWDIPVVANSILNSETGGLLARYGQGGALRGTLDYLWNHPFSPIGFTYPSFLFLGDSGPMQYLLRGSVPLLMLIYVGLYRFLRYNVPSRRHALTLFFAIVAFEIGFDALPYFRTLFLLPFFVVYLKGLVPAEEIGGA